ncbi:GLPGLI family protein [Psychroflexus sp. ALD_RP9]|uniref:GLPGLI family protein n=1 Tax=Psychroflexus sp. ALD_RP9 TaxID=2777186 RepID=UPI001A8FED38|nr:GLPGLI family protein [Psychroflexus sp. ALD_RP9]QSS97344.1 GLPGLI family protein [Psychroflexus sp. ALD_RP9]
MNYKRLYILIFIFSPAFLIAQSDFEITYKKRVLPGYFQISDSVSEVKKSRYLKTRNSVKRNIGKFKYTLQIDTESNISEFKVIKTMSVDGNERFNNNLKGMLGGRFPIYNHLKKDSVFENADFRGKIYFTRYKSPRYKWRLTKKTKDILGFKCYLAVTEESTDKTVIFNFQKDKKKAFHAWYAPSLPSKYGPSFFTGLPGLVLQAGNKKMEIYASDIKNVNNVKVEFPDKKSITHKQKINQLKAMIGR